VGEDIPLHARILCLVEYVDEIHMNGIAGEEFETESVKLVQAESGKKFDPAVVDAYLSLLNKAQAA
jgi:response regulator RpfG family c-di-GMP phosphodiesterase